MDPNMIFLQIAFVVILVMIGFKIRNNIYIDSFCREIFTLKDRTLFYPEDELRGYPVEIIRYLEYTQSLHQKAQKRLKVYYRGMMKFGPQKEWRRFRLKNGINYETQSYYLLGCISYFPGFHIRFFEGFKNHKARFEVFLGSMFRYLEGEGHELDHTGAMNYFLMALLSPAYLTREYFSFRSAGEGEVESELALGDQKLTASMVFDDLGRLRLVRSRRFYYSKGTFTELPWEVKVEKYDEFLGHRIPSVLDFYYGREENQILYSRLEVQKMYPD
ncbi:MAG: hypothetical protein AVO33_06345 [delta proteobacterium ML8_F1]|nr:MAG: hypothetical protein AVO33_06345 [delta proteobacterium ML8_F1]